MSGSLVDRLGTWVLAATLFIVPLAYGSTLSDPFALAKRLAMLAAALLLWGISLVAAGRDRRPGLVVPARPLALLFLASAAIACGTAINRGLALWGLLDLAVGVGLFLGTVRFARQARDCALLLRTTLAAAALVALGALVQVFVPAARGEWLAFFLPPSRGGSTLGDPGLAAQFLVLALPVGIGAMALSSDTWRQVCGGLLGAVAAALIFIGRPEGWWTGGAALFLAVAARVVQVAGHGGHWRNLVPELGGASLRAFLVAGIVVLAAVSLSRMTLLYPSGRPVDPLAGTSLLSPTTGDPAADRAAAIPATMALIGHHPLGVGPACFRHAFLEVAWTVVPGSPFSLTHQAVHAGNAFVETAAETGLLGGIAFALLVLVVLIQAFLAAARAAGPWDGLGATVVAVVGTLTVAGFLGAPFQAPTPSLLFWVTAGIAQVAVLQSGSAPRFLRALVSRERAAARAWGRRIAYAAGALWLAAVATLGVLVADRTRASMLALAGQGAFYAGRYDAALLALGQPAARRSPDHTARLLAGTSYLRLGFHDLAAQEFSETLRRSPYFVAAYLGRAAAWEAQGRWDLADADYRAALKIWPKNADIYLSLGNLDATRGRIDDALDDYRQVMQIDPNLADTYFRMGELFLRRGQTDEAIEAFRLCGAKNPKYPRMHLRLGDAFFQTGLQEMAVRSYQTAVANDDKDVEARLRLANALHAVERYCEAREALEAARDLETDASRRDAILDLIKKVEPDCRKEGKTPSNKR